MVKQLGGVIGFALFAVALSLPSIGGSSGNGSRIVEVPSLPNPSRVDEVLAFNFLTPNQNLIDGGSAGNQFYTSWDMGYGPEWNNLRSRSILPGVNQPEVGDGRYSLDGQVWSASRNGLGIPRPTMVNSEGEPRSSVQVTVEGSFSTYNTGGSPYGTTQGGVPEFWRHHVPSNVGSMGLSHLWIDARFWNDTDPSVTIRVEGIDDGRYMLVLYLNPTNHDPKRSALVGVEGMSFRLDHIEGKGYDDGNQMILRGIVVDDGEFSFDFSTYALQGVNMDSSLAGFALLELN